MIRLTRSDKYIMDRLPTNLELKDFYIRRLLCDLVLIKDEKVIASLLSSNKGQRKPSLIKLKGDKPSLQSKKYIDPNGFSSSEEDRKDVVLTLHYYND